MNVEKFYKQTVEDLITSLEQYEENLDDDICVYYEENSDLQEEIARCLLILFRNKPAELRHKLLNIDWHA